MAFQTTSNQAAAPVQEDKVIHEENISEDSTQVNLPGSISSEESNSSDKEDIIQNTKKSSGLLSNILTSVNIFVLDTNTDNLIDIRDLLEDDIIQVITFSKEEELFNELKVTTPNLVLCELDLSNVDTFKLMKQFFESYMDIPFIIMGTSTDSETMEKIFTQGAYTFVERPFDEKKLHGICKNAIIRNVAMTLLNKSTNIIMNQFNDLEKYFDDYKNKEGKKELYQRLSDIVDAKKVLLKYKVEGT